MASNIDTSKINTNYPVAGENNDTQGFRENFNEIKKNLDEAELEITELQNSTAKIDQDSNFLNNKIISAELDNITESYYSLGNIDSDTIIDFKNGHYQTAVIDNDLTLTLDRWPQEEKYAKVTVSLTITSASHTINWISFDQDGNPGIIKKNQGNSFLLSDSTEITVGRFPDPFIVDSETDPVVVEFWTVDGGETVHANYLGKFV